MDDKLPGAFIAAESVTGATSGNAHIQSITGSPVIDLTPGSSNGAYLVGGFGYYHKSTNFTGYVCCAYDYYGYYEVQVTLASVSSDQWGANGGIGFYHRLGGGGRYGAANENRPQIFAEARYTFIHTPPISQPDGLGTTGLIPVTLGIRF